MFINLWLFAFIRYKSLTAFQQLQINFLWDKIYLEITSYDSGEPNLIMTCIPKTQNFHILSLAHYFKNIKYNHLIKNLYKRGLTSEKTNRYLQALLLIIKKI